MNMIGHDNISSDFPVGRKTPCLKQVSVGLGIIEQSLPLMGADCDEEDNGP